ncbi:unnamed protein product [Paramecium primaurelia]|uniref:Uncharacterized protein n=1 Tax=Paramecium primaurelia TaxID=5886 RepID=A0A8S1KMJ1_PARPR|nr:unnamed protein product [Paramecium primaurelia]
MDQIEFKTLDEFIRLFHKKVSTFTTSEMQIQLQHLAQMLSEKQIQTEAKNDCFFKRWSEIKLPISLITIDFISQLFVIYTKVNETLKEDILLDFIWPLIVYEFEDKKVVVEYFNIMKTIYDKKYRELLKSFGILEIVKYMLKTTEIDDMICCEQHNNKEQPQQIISQEIQTKIDQFGLFINEIIHQMINDLKQATGNNLNDLESLFGISVHQLLSYCTKDHNCCQVQTLLIILLNQLPQVNADIIQKVFQNFEAISFIVLLYNSTTSQVLQVYCIKLFQVITNKNPSIIQKLILSIIPSSNNKNFLQNLHSEPLICSILEWLLNIPTSVKITEYQMFDEKLTFKNHDVMELTLNYLYICPVMMKQQLITTLYTLMRNNKENQLFLLSNKHFLSTFPKFLMSLQDDDFLETDENQNSLQKSIYDTSLKLISTVFMNQFQNGKIDMLFQWLKLAELEHIKQKNEDLDGFKDARTPSYFIRQLITYVFNNILKSSILNTSELSNEQLWRGFHLFIASFLAIITKDLIQQDQKISKLIGKKVAYSPQLLMITQLFENQNWIDYQFCIRIIQIVNFLYSQTISMNLDIIKPSINFKTSEFALWLNQLFKKILSNEKDNIFLMRIIQTLICYYQHYIVAQNFGQSQLEEIQQLLKAYRHFMQSLICGSQQFKNLKHIPVDIEYQITLSHYFYIESQMKLINQIKQKCQKDHHGSHDSFFNLYALQELIAYIQQQLQEYYLSLIKLCQIYGKRSQIFIWNFCYELIRIKKYEGDVLESYLQTLINQPDIIHDIVISDEMIVYYYDCPNMVNLKQKSQLKLNELIKWANLLIQQQEHEQILLYQEQYSRQSQILMKDVTKTLDKYNLIQLQNYEIFEKEKLKYDQSKTL